jgi:hypothetical protein
MSYDVRLVKPEGYAGEEPKYDSSDIPMGGTYCPGGTDLWFNITFNYSWYFYQTLPEDMGLKWLGGKKAKDVIPALEASLEKIREMEQVELKTGKVLSETWGKGSDFDPSNTDYWAVSARNAAKAIEGLIRLCKIAPDYEITMSY